MDERVTLVLPVTVYGVAALYRTEKDETELFSRSFAMPGIEPLTDAQAVHLKTAEIEDENPGMTLLGATASRVVIW